MSLKAKTIAITAVIICNNQTFGNKNCAAITRIRFALSNLAVIIGSENCAAIMRRIALSKLKHANQCSLHRKRFLKNIVSFTPIHKDEQITKKNSEEIISMFRWIAVLTVKRIQYHVLRKTIRVFHWRIWRRMERKKFLGVLKILLELCFGEFPRVISRKRPPFLGIYRNF